MKDLVSLIIRTKNEERWVSACLESVYNQTYNNFEVILVDNQSTDKTVEKAKQYDLKKIVYVDEYLPGDALNVGIRHSTGKYIVCLSAHCIPVNKFWLENLIRNFNREDIAGVYGRQEPMSFSSDFDKRDLLIVFGLDKRIQVKDSFFHNANSMVRRDVWDKIPFDDEATNIEDRIWAEQVLKEGYKLMYEPEASVYHYHGIHQNRDIQRCSNVVRILEELHTGKDVSNNTLDGSKMNITALIPMKGKPVYINDVPLMKYTIQRALESKYINQVIVSCDNEETASVAKGLGAKVPFIRDLSYSQDHIDLEKVYQYTLEMIEEQGIYPDIVVTLEITSPFRTKGFLDDLILEFINGGVDTVLPTRKEYNSCWNDNEGQYERIDEGFIPKKFKQPVYVGQKGLGCVTLPINIREGKLIGHNVEFVTVSDPFSFLHVADNDEIDLAGRLIPVWWQE